MTAHPRCRGLLSKVLQTISKDDLYSWLPRTFFKLKSIQKHLTWPLQPLCQTCCSSLEARSHTENYQLVIFKRPTGMESVREGKFVGCIVCSGLHFTFQVQSPTFLACTASFCSPLSNAICCSIKECFILWTSQMVSFKNPFGLQRCEIIQYLQKKAKNGLYFFLLSYLSLSGDATPGLKTNVRKLLNCGWSSLNQLHL